MRITASILACFAVALTPSLASTSEGGGFCYSDTDGCGPSSPEWSKVCHTGKRQSPIDLPSTTLTMGTTPMNFHIYKGNSFRLQNNGHSVQIDFNNQGPSTQQVAFPDPLQIYGPFSSMQGSRQYKFAAAHFHWGVNDSSVGSEHCVGGKCSAMELHLVHYLAKFPSLGDAVASGDENALAVLGVLIDPSALKPLIGMQSALVPIVNNLESVEHADHDASKWTTVNEPLDLNKLLFETLLPKPLMYSYKGSLTTPGCNEQVNWFVLKKPATVSHEDLEAFRTLVKDGRGKALTENHRPLQPKNGRKVMLSTVLGY